MISFSVSLKTSSQLHWLHNTVICRPFQGNELVNTFQRRCDSWTNRRWVLNKRFHGYENEKGETLRNRTVAGESTNVFMDTNKRKTLHCTRISGHTDKKLFIRNSFASQE
jgi:hypothetical protein